MCSTSAHSSNWSFGVCRVRLADQGTGSNIDWLWSSMEFACCATTMRRERATIGTFGIPRSPTTSPTRTRCWRISGAMSKIGGDRMKTVTLQVAKLADVKRRAQEAFKGRKLGSRISFATPELLFRLLTAKRWELIRSMAGAGPLSIREVARRVDRDVKAV